MKLSEEIWQESVGHDRNDLQLESWADRARKLEAELADTKAQLEYVRATVRTHEETAQDLEADVERLRVSCTGMRKAMEHAETRELAALGEIDAYRAAVTELRGLASAADYEVEPLQLHMDAILNTLPK